MKHKLRVDVCSPDAESYLAYMLSGLDEAGFATEVSLNMDGRGNKWWEVEFRKQEDK